VAVQTTDCFAGILGILYAGCGYVPINPAFPVQRIIHMIDVAQLDTMIVDASVIEAMRCALLETPRPLWLLITGLAEIPGWCHSQPNLNAALIPNSTPATPIAIPSVKNSESAYTMFTSGSTGVPKGVEISHGNITSFLRYIMERYDLGLEDRFSQMFELTFDLSLFDMFACWGVGGALCVVPAQSRVVPAKFIREQRLTAWFSVPSVGATLAKLKVLRPGVFPDLRLSLFCGEALTANVAELWTSAAPNSVVENLYGPTEATVACAYYRWNNGSAAECLHGVVPIGRAFPEHDARVVDEKGAEATPGSPGELCIAGPQVAAGYLQNPKLTKERFVDLTFEGETRRYYRTGDLVVRNERDELLFLGRTDFQVKWNGYRIELGEIEHCLRKASGIDRVAVVAARDANGVVERLLGFVEDSRLDAKAVLSVCERTLPAYMVPSSIRLVPEMPLNSNGKIDRNRLVELFA
jgi:amino acid adenylation domain-containing protein